MRKLLRSINGLLLSMRGKRIRKRMLAKNEDNGKSSMGTLRIDPVSFFKEAVSSAIESGCPSSKVMSVAHKFLSVMMHSVVKEDVPKDLDLWYKEMVEEMAKRAINGIEQSLGTTGGISDGISNDDAERMKKLFGEKANE